MSHFFRVGIRNTQAVVALLLYGIFLVWWTWLHLASGDRADALQFWSGYYQLIAWYGASVGFFVSIRWGGLKSHVGRAIISFALGLLFQCFGQTAYYIYVHVLNIPIPYPSIGDVGYFGSIPFYFYGAYMLAKISGAKVSLRSYSNQLQAIIIPVLMLGLSYFLFLKGYEFDWSQPTKILLDFGYPLGQAMYVSVAVLALSLSWKVLGGIMRLPILCFIAALVFQYLCDFVFLYQASQGTFTAGGINDQMYSISYLIMTIALVYIGRVFYAIKET